MLCSFALWWCTDEPPSAPPNSLSTASWPLLAAAGLNRCWACDIGDDVKKSLLIGGMVGKEPSEWGGEGRRGRVSLMNSGGSERKDVGEVTYNNEGSLFTINLINYRIYLPKGRELKKLKRI